LPNILVGEVGFKVKFYFIINPAKPHKKKAPKKGREKETKGKELVNK
jgi:hypothetical protein